MTAKPKEPDTQTVVAEILAGRHDGHLVDIMDGVTARIRQGAVRHCWRLRLDGEEWTEQTVTSGELAYAERLLNRSYLSIDPKARLADRIALVVAHLCKTSGADENTATARAEAMTIAEQEDLFDVYEVTDNPKDDPEASTSS